MMPFLSFKCCDEGLASGARPSRCYQVQALRPHKVNLSVALLGRTVALRALTTALTVLVLVLALFSRVILRSVLLIIWHYSLHLCRWVCAFTNTCAASMFRRNIFTGQEA
ncbi:MAG: hypothetical protein DYH13_11250 [Alphaproteobacteria bacterium PRO2]|nr:hypothetical protein [Alphaproteobacteria bacterium PRO2]